jgi:hypothetical protein
MNPKNPDAAPLASTASDPGGGHWRAWAHEEKFRIPGRTFNPRLRMKNKMRKSRNGFGLIQFCSKTPKRAMAAAWWVVVMPVLGQSSFTFNVPLDQSQLTRRPNQDTWLIPWQELNGYVLAPGGKVEFDVQLPANYLIETYDRWRIDGDETIHVNVQGHLPAGTTHAAWSANQFRVDFWFTGLDSTDPIPNVPTASHPWSSLNTPYAAKVDPANGDITYTHSYNMTESMFSFTGVHVELTATSEPAGYYLDWVQIGFGRDKLYFRDPHAHAPEPTTMATFAGLGMVGFVVVRRLRAGRVTGGTP